LIQNVFEIIIKKADIIKIDEKKKVSIDVPLKKRSYIFKLFLMN
jgi:hypothetical protein